MLRLFVHTISLSYCTKQRQLVPFFKCDLFPSMRLEQCETAPMFLAFLYGLFPIKLNPRCQCYAKFNLVHLGAMSHLHTTHTHTYSYPHLHLSPSTEQTFSSSTRAKHGCARCSHHGKSRVTFRRLREAKRQNNKT